MAKKPVVTLTTDFGLKDEYVGSLKAAILSYSRDITIVDISHEISPFAISEAALIVSSAVPHFKDAVHLCIVDPEVGSERKIIVLKTAFGSCLVGPDNGVLIPASQRLGGITSAFVIKPEYFSAKKISPTFHGRDIFAPAAAMVACGVSPTELGEPLDISELKPSPFRVDYFENGFLTEVVSVDRFGTLRLPVLWSDFTKMFGPIKTVELKHSLGKAVLKRYDYFAQVRKGEVFFYEDSSGYFSIASNTESAAKILNLDAGSKVKITCLEEK